MPVRARELAAVLLFHLALFCAAALGSYDPLDASVEGGLPGALVHNACGAWGARLAEGLYAGFGLGALWFPVLFLAGAVLVFLQSGIERAGMLAASGLGLVWATGGFLALFGEHLAVAGPTMATGGVFGYLAQAFLSAILTRAGAGIFLFLAMGTTLPMVFGFPPGAFLKTVLGVFHWVWDTGGRKKTNRKTRRPAPRQTSEAISGTAPDTAPGAVQKAPRKTPDKEEDGPVINASYQAPEPVEDSEEEAPPGEPPSRAFVRKKAVEKKLDAFQQRAEEILGPWWRGEDLPKGKRVRLLALGGAYATPPPSRTRALGFYLGDTALVLGGDGPVPPPEEPALAGPAPEEPQGMDRIRDIDGSMSLSDWLALDSGKPRDSGPAPVQESPRKKKRGSRKAGAEGKEEKQEERSREALSGAGERSASAAGADTKSADIKPVAPLHTHAPETGPAPETAETEAGEKPPEAPGPELSGPCARGGETSCEASAPVPEHVRSATVVVEADPAGKELVPSPPSVPAPSARVFLFPGDATYRLPGEHLLEDPPPRPVSTSEEQLQAQARLIEAKLENFKIQGRTVAAHPGPVITTFEYEPAPGIKINRISSLADDLAMALKALAIRIVAPIPGKGAVGIEVPNANRELVCFKEMAASPAFSKSKSKLTLCLGKDIVGTPVVANLARMPHLLIAGATGSGKSVALNCIISSILFKAAPWEVKFVMIDPKRIELSHYNDIPHLITPVVCDVKKANNALFWAVCEMEARYEAMAAAGVRNIGHYNEKAREGAQGPDEEVLTPLPYIVIVIDELADLMMVASKEVEVHLARLAQMARAAGIHLILATQRPSVDVLTGIIKANFPTRVAFQVSSRVDSRTILDQNGAEHLLGMGDMLFMPPGAGKLQRLHGAYISEAELARVLAFVRSQGVPEYDHRVTEGDAPPENGTPEDEGETDPMYDQAVAVVRETRQASISSLQRRLRVGYNRAARMIEKMEKDGYVGPSDGLRPREVLVRRDED
jgi:S-DNA-T family DNA segregation ATPase FtsK/SpoIIIE